MFPAMDVYGSRIVIAAPVASAVDVRKSLLFCDIILSLSIAAMDNAEYLSYVYHVMEKFLQKVILLKHLLPTILSPAVTSGSYYFIL